MDFRNAHDQVAALRARHVSAVELCERAIARIGEYDVQLNAVVVRDFERARAAANLADQALARGDARPLLGVPMTVKEAFNVAQLPTTWGIPGTERIPIQEDAVAIRRLKAAGAIIIGKTNVPTSLADWQTSNPVYGTTNNPWDPARTPGGSSGGSAAALAAGFVALELGTDMNGSLRIPAHCCGVFAHKPTHALVPMRGCVPPGTPQLPIGFDVDLAVAGPMARSATDLAAVLDVIAGPDDYQAKAYAVTLPPPRRTRLKDFRVLLLLDHPLLPLANEVRDCIEEFARNLERLGCEVRRANPALPDLREIARHYGLLLMALIGATLPLADYEAVRQQAPRTRAGAPDAELTEMQALAATHRDWLQADRARVAIMSHWSRVFQESDVVICPVQPTVAFPQDLAPMDKRVMRIDRREVPYKDIGHWSELASLAKLPATAMPIPTAGKLPVGVQIVGDYLEDRTTLEFARLAEQEWGGFIVPPRFSGAAASVT